MHNTTQYYKDFKQKVLESIETMNNAGVKDKTLIIKISPDILLNMLEDMLEILETENGKQTEIVCAMRELFWGILPTASSKKDVYNAVNKLRTLLFDN